MLERQSACAMDADSIIYDEIEKILDSDSKMKEPDRAYVKAFFKHLELSTIGELVDINSFQPVKTFLQEALVEYNKDG